MNKLNYIFLLTAGVLSLAACKPEVNVPAATSGSADFTRYIAVGNSLTAGYADDGLYREGQLNSFPSIIARQMAEVGGGPFAQPLFSEEHANGSGYLKLNGFDANGSPITAREASKLAVRGEITVPVSPTSTTKVVLFDKYTGDINNYGVPAIKLVHATLGAYGNLNGFYERLLPGNAPANSTAYIDFVTAKPFTFFSNWLGNNDALGYAISGGAGDVLTSKTDFAALYTQVTSMLTAGGQKRGVVATIPDVTAIPYFSTVTIDAILASVKRANPAVAALYVNARTTATDGAAAYAPRVATAADLVVLTFPTSKIGTPVTVAPGATVPYGLHPLAPIENQYVLDANEVTLTKDYINAYNTSIKSIAARTGLAVADMFTFLNTVKQSGLLVDGVTLTSSYISGGLFSLDGVHLTPRGSAVVANEFIKTINATYGSNIPLANVTGYRAVKIP